MASFLEDFTRDISRSLSARYLKQESGTRLVLSLPEKEQQLSPRASP
jgi:hypothetical protein